MTDAIATYYSYKTEILKNTFGAESVSVTDKSLRVDDVVYPIHHNVIILLNEKDYQESIRGKVSVEEGELNSNCRVKSECIQHAFGEEWKEYNKILPEHEIEFRTYFDIVDMDSLKGQRICDLGCGNERWSYFYRNMPRS